MIVAPRSAAALSLLALSFVGADTALARQVTSEVVEALIVHLDQKGAESRAHVDSVWGAHGVHPRDRPETVFVLNRENLEQVAGMSLGDVESLMRALHSRGVPARWCQVPCRTAPGDQLVTLKWAFPVRPHRLLVEAEVRGRHRRDEFNPIMDAWMSRVSFNLIRTGGKWRVTGSSVGYTADMTTLD